MGWIASNVITDCFAFLQPGFATGNKIVEITLMKTVAVSGNFNARKRIEICADRCCGGLYGYSRFVWKMALMQ